MLHRLAKWERSFVNGSCPALYATDEPTWMIGQGKKLLAGQQVELLELGSDEIAIRIPTETVFRGIAKYAAEHGDDDLAGRIEAFLTARTL